MVNRDSVTPVNVTGDFSDDWVYLDSALGSVSALNQNRTEPSKEEPSKEEPSKEELKTDLQNRFCKIKYLLGLWSFHCW